MVSELYQLLELLWQFTVLAISMNDLIKKNVLDLNYSKHLQYKITAIIVATTYLFAVTISLFTEDLKLNNPLHMSVLAIFSIIVLTPCIFIILDSSKHLSKIVNLVKGLK